MKKEKLAKIRVIRGLIAGFRLVRVRYLFVFTLRAARTKVRGGAIAHVRHVAWSQYCRFEYGQL
jgi:hypothetical protein